MIENYAIDEMFSLDDIKDYCLKGVLFFLSEFDKSKGAPVAVFLGSDGLLVTSLPFSEMVNADYYSHLLFLKL